MQAQARLSFPICKVGTLASAWAAGSRARGQGWAGSLGPSANGSEGTFALLLNNVKSCIRRVAVLIVGPGFGFLEQSGAAFLQPEREHPSTASASPRLGAGW